jgi:prepilin-type N-terminal cleavage/methylation domain-containing protein
MKKLNKKGFTLIELIVVIAILAILAAILIPAVTGYITKATDGKDQANCRSLFSQVTMDVMLDNINANGTVTGNGVSAAYTGSYVSENTVSTFVCTGTNKIFSLDDSPSFAGEAKP